MPGATDPIKAAAVQAYDELGYTPRAISNMCDIAGSTARDIINRVGHWGKVADRPVFVRLRNEQKAALQSATLAVAAKALIQVDEKIDKASAYQAAGIYGLLRTHERLDAGEATVNVEVHVDAVVTIDDLSSRLSRRLVDK